MTERIEDIISEGFVASRNTLLEVFELENALQLIPFQKIMAAMRGLPAEAQKDIVVPIIRKLSSELGVDPSTSRGQEAVAEFVDIFALAIQDATQFIIQNMERQQQTSSLLRTGRGSSLM